MVIIITKIQCSIEYGQTENENGRLIDSVTVTCPCGCSETSFGTTSRSINRSLALLHEHCSKGNNFYFIDATDGSI